MESVLWGSSARYMIRPQLGNPFAGRNRVKMKPQDLANPFTKKSPMRLKEKGLIEEVALLVNKLNDKAYLYKSGKIDIVKNGKIVVRKFPNKKDASLYLLKAGWQYVR